MEKSRKYIVLTVLVAMVAVAGYLNLSYNEEDSPGKVTMVSTTPVKQENSETLKSAEETKNLSRSKAMELLNVIIKDEATDKESREKASSELVSIADNMEKEGVISGILKTKGFPLNVVFITDGSTTVTVQTEKALTAAQVAQIQDIVKSNAKTPGDKITISQVK